MFTTKQHSCTESTIHWNDLVTTSRFRFESYINQKTKKKILLEKIKIKFGCSNIYITCIEPIMKCIHNGIIGNSFEKGKIDIIYLYFFSNLFHSYRRYFQFELFR